MVVISVKINTGRNTSGAFQIGGRKKYRKIIAIAPQKGFFQVWTEANNTNIYAAINLRDITVLPFRCYFSSRVYIGRYATGPKVQKP